MQIGWAISLEEGYADRFGHTFPKENKGMQVGWTTPLEGNKGMQIGWAISLEENEGMRTGWERSARRAMPMSTAEQHTATSPRGLLLSARD